MVTMHCVHGLYDGIYDDDDYARFVMVYHVINIYVWRVDDYVVTMMYDIVCDIIYIRLTCGDAGCMDVCDA